MRRPARAWWAAFAMIVVAVVAPLVWISHSLLRLEEAEIQARAEAERQGPLRLALWRMDSWLLPLLAREAARPYLEYLPSYPQGRSDTRRLDANGSHDLPRPSPRVTARDETIRLHFQFDPDGNLSSPQVPPEDLLEQATSAGLSGEDLSRHKAWLDRVAALVDFQSTRRRVGELEEQESRRTDPGEITLAPSVAPTLTGAAQRQQMVQNQVELQARTKAAWAARNAEQGAAQQHAGAALGADGATGELSVRVGGLVPLWMGESGDELFFFRRVQVGKQALLQGIYFDWPRLATELLDEIEDLVPNASLEPLATGYPEDDPTGLTLATVPLALHARAVLGPTGEIVTPARLTVGVAWAVVLLAMLAAGLTLRSSLTLAEKRSRFASAVTHELRTPLTTFRMYSEMLAEGMVPSEEKRRLYLQTLKQESDRLATLVENVLSYARLEDGRSVVHRDRLTAGDLIERQRGPLERRVRDAGKTLAIELNEARDAMVFTDGDAVGQILFNLVDNACKYACRKDDPAIELTAVACASFLELRVRDRGPGIPPAVVRKVFAPFERGEHQGEATPGIGLGLALSRELARDLGGRLELEASPAGACFALRLPLAAD